jgi:CRP/FNR family transcriptional regulator
VLTRDGREEVMGYHMGGEIVGIDGIVDSRHACDVIALEDSEVCVLPLDLLARSSTVDSVRGARRRGDMHPAPDRERISQLIYVQLRD